MCKHAMSWNCDWGRSAARGSHELCISLQSYYYKNCSLAWGNNGVPQTGVTRAYTINPFSPSAGHVFITSTDTSKGKKSNTLFSFPFLSCTHASRQQLTMILLIHMCYALVISVTISICCHWHVTRVGGSQPAATATAHLSLNVDDLPM